MEVQQEEQAQELYNRVAELEAHVMDVFVRLEGEFYPTYLTLLAGRRWLLTHGIQPAILKCLKSSEYQGIQLAIPWLVMNAVFSSSSLVILIWWYPLYAFRKHLKGYPQRDYTFQSISGSGYPSLGCHTPRRGLDGTRVRRRDLISHLKYKA
ncbi:hypothetical protein Tco_0182897 [Tanacetum coccineum]